MSREGSGWVAVVLAGAAWCVGEVPKAAWVSSWGCVYGLRGAGGGMWGCAGVWRACPAWLHGGAGGGDSPGPWP